MHVSFRADSHNFTKLQLWIRDAPFTERFLRIKKRYFIVRANRVYLFFKFSLLKIWLVDCLVHEVLFMKELNLTSIKRAILLYQLSESFSHLQLGPEQDDLYQLSDYEIVLRLRPSLTISLIHLHKSGVWCAFFGPLYSKASQRNPRFWTWPCTASCAIKPEVFEAENV